MKNEAFALTADNKCAKTVVSFEILEYCLKRVENLFFMPITFGILGTRITAVSL